MNPTTLGKKINKSKAKHISAPNTNKKLKKELLTYDCPQVYLPGYRMI